MTEEQYTQLLVLLTRVDLHEFVKQMQNQHRTFQQDFTRLAVAWLQCAGSDEYTFDGRNEASHNVGKIVTDALEAVSQHQSVYLPRV